jgi:hypothetical protein
MMLRILVALKTAPLSNHFVNDYSHLPHLHVPCLSSEASTSHCLEYCRGIVEVKPKQAARNIAAEQSFTGGIRELIRKLLGTFANGRSRFRRRDLPKPTFVYQQKVHFQSD